MLVIITGALLTDLSKAFACIDHELLSAKRHAYDLDIGSLYFLFSYHANRKQRTKANSSYSDFNKILKSIPKGSTLGSLFIDIYILTYFMTLKIWMCLVMLVIIHNTFSLRS